MSGSRTARRRLPRRAPLLLASLGIALGGCAASPWYKAGQDAAGQDAAADLAACEMQASAEARRHAASGPGQKPEVIVGANRSVGVRLPASVAAPVDPVTQEAALSACMRGKGYERGDPSPAR